MSCACVSVCMCVWVHIPVVTTQREEILLCNTLPHSLEPGTLSESEARLEGKPQACLPASNPTETGNPASYTGAGVWNSSFP